MAQVKPVNKKKMSGPSIAALIVTIAILIGLVVSLLAGSGLFVRIQDGASSENYKINGSMMSYYVNSFYQSWYSNYYYYILLGYISFNPNVPFDQQYTDANKTQTYYDYFKEGATVNVTKILKYCEAARVDDKINFAELEQEAKDYAATTIKSLKATAKENGYDFNTFVRQNFGQYVSEKDLKNAIILEYIANDYSNTLYDRIYDEMTDDRKAQYFNEHLSEFITADYLTFTLSQTVEPEKVDPKAYEQGENDPAYKEAVAAAQEAAKKANEMNKIADKELIDRLAKAESADEFKRILISHKYDESFKAAYDKAVSGFATTDKPTEEEWKEFAASVKDAIIDAVIAGKTDITTDTEEGEGEVETTADAEATETKWEKAKKSLPSTVISSLKSVITNATKSGSYAVDTEVGKFFFSGVKAQYGIEYAEGETEGENAKVGDYFIDDAEIKDETQKACGYYTLTVYYVTESAHRDETILRNAGHILFPVDEKGKTEGAYKTFEEAKEAAEKVLAEIQATAKDGVVEKDVFETFAKEHSSDTNVFYDDVNKGDMVEEFEEWLFAATTVGEIGLIKSEKYGYHIMFYNGESDEAWRVSAHASAANEDLTKMYEGYTFNVTINENIFKTILAN